MMSSIATIESIPKKRSHATCDPGRCAILLAGLLILSTSGSARAQPLFASLESLDIVALDCDLLVRGTVASHRLEKHPEGGEFAVVTLNVVETLKGNHRSQREFSTTAVPTQIEHWKAQRNELLVGVSRAPHRWSRLIDLEDERLFVVTADLKTLRDRDAVLTTARQIVQRDPGVLRIQSFKRTLPREIVAGTRWDDYHSVSIVVPVDDRLEQYAVASLRHENLLIRTEALQAIRHFRCPRYRERVRPLLDDPGWAYRKHPDENQGSGVRIYLARREAFRTLRAWGIDIEKPTIRETFRANEQTE